VIAAINGIALGGGVEIIAACDLAYASDHVELGLPEVRVGLAAIGGGALQRLARQIPLKQAMEMALTGRRYSAAEAKNMGLINGIVPGAELMAKARAVADTIVAGAPLSVSGSKEVMVRSIGLPDLRTALAAHYPIVEQAFASEDAKEGQRAFVEKRKPVWKGK
jgi:crotonobetainyl-CoA hydratase